MIARDDFDRHLTAWLVAGAPTREPEHLLGRVLARTARERRRPSWLIPERWSHMSSLTLTEVVPPVPWRTIGLLALLLMALGAVGILVAGMQPTRLPAPFGPAANGLVAFSAEGDIYTVDPVSGDARVLIGGPETDLGPVYSHDGTHLAFRREVAGGYALYVAREDGRDLVRITPDAAVSIESVTFSPDGREVMFTSGTPSKISIASANGSAMRTLDLPLPAHDPTYRPPDGAQIAFIGNPTLDLDVDGLYLVNADGTGLRVLVEPSRSNTTGYPRWSPDGTRLAYSAADFTVQSWTVRVHVMAADGGADRILPVPADAVWSDGAVWSNDGTRLAMLRGYSEYGDSDVVAVVIPPDGRGTGLETGHFAGFPAFVWAPDDTSVLVLPDQETFRQSLILDPRTGLTTPTTWASALTASWQRLVP